MDTADSVREWFAGYPGRATLIEISAYLGGGWDSAGYHMLEEALEGLWRAGLLERVEVMHPVLGERQVFWQRPQDVDGEESNKDPGEISGVIQLDEASFDALTQILESPPRPNEALRKLLQEGGRVFEGDPAAIYESLGGSGLPEPLGSDGAPIDFTAEQGPIDFTAGQEPVTGGPLFADLSGGDDPREHCCTDPGVRFHEPYKPNHELAKQACEATRQVLAKKDKDEFAEWVKAQFARVGQRIDLVESVVSKLDEKAKVEIARLDEKINGVHRRVLRGGK